MIQTIETKMELSEEDKSALMQLSKMLTPVLLILIEEGFINFPRKFESSAELTETLDRTVLRLAPYIKHFAET